MKIYSAIYLSLISFFYPSVAYAYLDPGTGNLLVYLFISLLGVCIYSVKNLYFKLYGLITGQKATAKNLYNNQKLTIFSEGKLYWSTFKPLVDELLKRQIPFAYISMDIEDPALEIDNENMHSKYIGIGSAAFARVSNVKSNLMLATTPNIGTEGYPMPYPSNTKKLAHVCHGIGDIGGYKKYSLDHYDIVFMMNNNLDRSIRELEIKRNTPKKVCVPGGIPYVDTLVKKAKLKKNKSKPPIILLAPSWGERNLLNFYDWNFINWIAEANYKLIIRPHPHSLTVEKELIERLSEYIKSFENIKLDLDIDGVPSLEQADLLISDFSGVRFDFAFIYLKPVITFNMPTANRDSLELGDLDYIWEEKVEQEIGAVLEAEEIKKMERDEFLQVIEKSLNKDTNQMLKLSKENMPYAGKSAKTIVDWCINFIKE